MSCGCSPLGGGGGAAGCGAVWGSTWFVSPDFAGPTQNGSASCPFLTAQAAVDAAGDGDAIVLGVGNAGAVNVGDKSISFFGVAATLDGNVSTLDAVTATGDPTRIAFTNVVLLSLVASATLATFDTSFVVGRVEVSGFTAHQSTFLLSSDTDAFIVTTFASSFYDCTFQRSGEGTVTLTPGTFGISFDRTSAQSFQDGQWLYDVPSSVSALPLDLEPNLTYGDGVDGSLAAGFGALTITRDMYFSNVAFQAGDSINANGFRIFVSGLLDLRSAPAGAITWNGTVGSAAAGQTAGAASATPNIGSLGIELAGAAGGTGGAIGSAGVAGSGSISTSTPFVGGEGGNGGKGGTSVGAGAAGGATSGAAQRHWLRRIVDRPSERGSSVAVGGFSASGGGGGGGGVGVGGGGGGGASTTHLGFLAARVILRDATTNAAALLGTGAVGGAGGTAPGAGTGSGGGGGGGGGGTGLYITTDWLVGDVTQCIAANGGVGGVGGNGVTSDGGTGGQGGDSGTILFGELITNNWDFVDITAGTAGSAPAGSTGGAGGAGGAAVLSI